MLLLSRAVAFAALSLLLVVGVTPDAGAQVAGQVRSPSGPLPQATVVLWDGTRELARITTDSGGRFRFAGAVAASASGLVVRRLVYAPRTIGVRPGDEALRLTLAPLTQSLPAAVVTATRRQCPFREDPAARAWWNAVRAGYAVAPPAVGQLAIMTWRRSDVPATEVAEIDEERIGPGAHGVTGRARLDYDASVAAHGYADRRAVSQAGTTVLDEAYFAWWYPPLHREMVEEFVGARFGRHHVFRFMPAASGLDGSDTGKSPARLLFCPRDRAVPALEGAMEIASDSSISQIQWSFVTPKPREDAGGEVVLVPPGPGPGRRVVPARGAYWRRLAGRTDRYFQDVAIYRGWYWGTTDSIPNVPVP